MDRNAGSSAKYVPPLKRGGAAGGCGTIAERGGSDYPQQVGADVTYVENMSGWASAVIVENISLYNKVALPGERIAIRKRHGLAPGDRGKRVRCKIIPNKRAGRTEKWFAIEVKYNSWRRWHSWQDGKDALALTLPNTSPGSDHGGIQLACWKCGRWAVEPWQIFSIKNTGIWTRSINSSVFQVDPKRDYNDCKKCFVQKVHCSICKNSVGSFYATRYENCVEGQPFPCFKLITAWESANWEGEKPKMATVLVGDKDTVKESISKLNVSEEWEIDRHFQGGGRIDLRTYHIIEEAKRVLLEKEGAEKRAKEAEELAEAKEQELVKAKSKLAKKLADTNIISAEAQSTLERAKAAEQELVKAKAVETELTKKLAHANISAKGVTWVCKVNVTLIQYPVKVCNILEAGYIQGKKIRFSLLDKHYEVDFGSSTEPKQVNIITGCSRNICRLEVGNPKTDANVIWECNINGEWVSYPSDISTLIENHFHSWERADFSLLDKDYKIDMAGDKLKQVNKSTGFERKVRRRDKTVAIITPPRMWANHPEGENCILVDVTDSTEMGDVIENFKATMPSSTIIKIQRIQNHHLWEYYCFRRERIMKLSGGKDPNIVRVWHGTRGSDPLIICKDESDGLMMQYSRKGMWGRGIYFAENASYSDAYANEKDLKEHLPFGQTTSIKTKSLILASLVSGGVINLPPDSSLKACPKKSDGTGRYDTVTGTTQGSKVYIVYENGRAYPEYLVTYTDF